MTSRPEIVLYTEDNWISPYAFSVFVTLYEKQLAHRVVAMSIARNEQRTEAYRRRSPSGFIPCLEHGTFALSESGAIVEYLEEAFPPERFERVLPASREGRARARQVMSWLRTDLSTLRAERSTATMFYDKADAPLSPRGRKDADQLMRVADALVLEGTGSILGEWCIADAELAFMLQRLILNGDAVPERLRAYAEREWKRPSVAAYVAHPRPPALDGRLRRLRQIFSPS